ncbi:aspartate dehydrogenase [Methylobrevis pamukkalensis]|uniref:L-aspartate dehydrogenase n=1 Tax=Methylobrevis pamukkalensis TaxID=1439726 RepID=A0A1E3H4H5_9HYPH|nr:aspartate dehydrogenase [Methylobrevis pamukkalensis]ODN71247.1 L-aspartate dehydrogenase [Methylobrevis pamukkalensis]
MSGVALIGFGAIGRALAIALTGDTAISMAGVLLRTGSDSRDQVPGGLPVVEDTAGLIALAPSVVIECAGHAAATLHVPDVLRAGIDVILASSGVLADPQAAAEFEDAARAGGARLILTPGAVGGLDVLAAARLGGLDRVVYTGVKPPAAWRGTPAESLVDLDRLTNAHEIFRGSARMAAATYPKNANVAASVALAGLGFEATEVRLVANPATTTNRHRIEASGRFGRFAIDLDNAPLPGNPKSSALTALAIERLVRTRFAAVVV